LQKNHTFLIFIKKIFLFENKGRRDNFVE